VRGRDLLSLGVVLDHLRIELDAVAAIFRQRIQHVIQAVVSRRVAYIRHSHVLKVQAAVVFFLAQDAVDRLNDCTFESLPTLKVDIHGIEKARHLRSAAKQSNPVRVILAMSFFKD